MALTDLQRALCRLIAENRVASGESYVAGGVALNELIGAPLAATWALGRVLLERNGYAVRLVR